MNWKQIALLYILGSIAVGGCGWILSLRANAQPNPADIALGVGSILGGIAAVVGLIGMIYNLLTEG